MLRLFLRFRFRFISIVAWRRKITESSSVVSRAFSSALTAYLQFGHHPHPLGYLFAKFFCFFCPSIVELAHGEKSQTQSLTHSLTQLIWSAEPKLLLRKTQNTHMKPISAEKTRFWPCVPGRSWLASLMPVYTRECTDPWNRTQTCCCSASRRPVPELNRTHPSANWSQYHHHHHHHIPCSISPQPCITKLRIIFVYWKLKNRNYKHWDGAVRVVETKYWH